MDVYKHQKWGQEFVYKIRHKCHQYTEDGFPENPKDYEYPVPPPQVIMIPGPVIEEYASSGSGGGGGGGSDPSQDSGELR